MKWQEQKNNRVILKMLSILVYRMCCSFETGKRIQIDSASDETFYWSVCMCAALYFVFWCQKIIYFVYGISWHWIYDQTIEPPSNSFGLCAHYKYISKHIPRQNNCNENAVTHQLLLCHIELILSLVISSPPKLCVCVCVSLNSKWSMANHNHNYNQHQRHGK